MGLFNSTITSVEGVRENDFLEFYNYAESYADLTVAEGKFDGPDSLPGEEYSSLGPFLGMFMTVLRTSLGDFDFESSMYLTT